MKKLINITMIIGIISTIFPWNVSFDAQMLEKIKSASDCGIITANNGYNVPCAQESINFINPSFEESIGGLIPETEVPGWNTTEADGLIEIGKDTASHLESLLPFPDGKQIAELNAYEAAALYQDFTTVPGQQIFYSFDHGGRTSAAETQTMKLKVGVPNDNYGTDIKNPTMGKEADVKATSQVSRGEWKKNTGVVTIPAGQTTTRIAFSSDDVGGQGNELDNINFATTGVYDNSVSIEQKDSSTMHVSNTLNNLAGDINGTSSVTYKIKNADLSSATNISVSKDGVDYTEFEQTITGDELKISGLPTQTKNIQIDFDINPQGYGNVEAISNFKYESYVKEDLEESGTIEDTPGFYISDKEIGKYESYNLGISETVSDNNSEQMVNGIVEPPEKISYEMEISNNTPVAQSGVVVTNSFNDRYLDKQTLENIQIKDGDTTLIEGSDYTIDNSADFINLNNIPAGKTYTITCDITTKSTIEFGATKINNSVSVKSDQMTTTKSASSSIEIAGNDNAIQNTVNVCEQRSCDTATGIEKKTSIIQKIDYKINAITHEITLHLETKVPLTNGFTMAVGDSNSATLNKTYNDETQIDENDGFTNITADYTEQLLDPTNQLYEIKTGDLDSLGFSKDGIYSLAFFEDSAMAQSILIPRADGLLIGAMTIDVPQIITSGRTNYSVIGDLSNDNTDSSEVSAVEKYDPTKPIGVYELESIGYEETNGVDGDTLPETDNETDWKNDDLTLSKYDHVIRPLDGNYAITNDIDATMTQTNQDEDNIGGFGVDGFRPIGQKVLTIDGTDSNSFGGIISGDVDTICGNDTNLCKEDKSEIENTYIKNMYIQTQTITNVGMIAVGDDMEINNLGMIDPNISGQSNVGSFVGRLWDSEPTLGEGNELLNVYASSGSANSKILGTENNIGGIVGTMSDTNLSSDGRFKALVPGISETDPGDQTTNFPDSDGYKTFSTANVENTGVGTGGVVGNTVSSTVNKIYSKAKITSGVGDNTGGIIGVGTKLTVKNSYYSSIKNTIGITSQGRYVGGIVGHLIGAVENENKIENVYNTADIVGKQVVAGIVGFADFSQIKNAYNLGNIEATKEAASPSYVGGITGNSSDAKPIIMSEVYNAGNIKGLGTAVAGIAGELSAQSSVVKPQITNAINAGSIDSPVNLGASISASKNEIYNVYNYEGAQMNGTDVSANIVKVATSANLKNITWWKSTLFSGNSEILNNWNIDSGNAVFPVPDSDPLDQSTDDTNGTVNNGIFPTLKEVGESTEIPEQTGTVLPAGAQTPSSISNFKINSMNLDITVHFEKVPTNSTVEIYNKEDITHSVSLISTQIESNDVVIKNVDDDDLTTGINPNTTYDIMVKDESGEIDGGALTVTTPGLLMGDNNPTTLNDNYALIGDEVNEQTNISNKIQTSQINYGIYELESIGYEDANQSLTDWTGNNLTLSKYDHIIRPINGNYLIANNIDASVTLETEGNQKTDQNGGWSTDNTDDGFRPIGQKVNTTSGDDSVQFTGNITGDVDTICGTDPTMCGTDKSEIENTYIENLYINEPTFNNIGMISVGNDVSIDNLGIIDPSIEGMDNVGAFVGSLNNSILSNVYASQTDENSEEIIYDVIGENKVGGITGEAINSTIKSNDRFTKDEVLQNVKQGAYKTFSNLDLLASEEQAGGIAGYIENTNIEQVYSQGNISGNSIVGGLVGEGKNFSITNTYFSGENSSATSTSDSEGAVGGIVGKSTTSNESREKQENTINNTYNSGEIKTKFENSGGIIGISNSTKNSNVYNTGNISGEQFVGGIIGNTTGSSPSIITNAYNTGDIVGENEWIGGISGKSFSEGNTENEIITISNVLNVGNVKSNSEDVQNIATISPAIDVLKNTWSTIQSEPIDINQGTRGYENVEPVKLASVNWWKNIFFEEDSQNYQNWNIEENDTNTPSNKGNPKNDLGTVTRIKYPKLIEYNENTKTTSKLEIPSQKDIDIQNVEIEKIPDEKENQNSEELYKVKNSYDVSQSQKDKNNLSEVFKNEESTIEDLLNKYNNLTEEEQKEVKKTLKKEYEDNQNLYEDNEEEIQKIIDNSNLTSQEMKKLSQTMEKLVEDIS